MDEFKTKFEKAKELNAEFQLEGSVVNELGAINKNHERDCTDSDVAEVAKQVLDFLKEDAGATVTQVAWFNQPANTGNVFNCELVDNDATQLNEIGKAYLAGCTAWSKAAANNTGA